MACMLVTHDRFEAARLSHEIMLLSTKGMNVQNVMPLPTPLSERDSAFEEAVVAREFQGIHYYEWWGDLNIWRTLRFVALSLTLSHGARGSGFWKSEGAGLGIEWQVNLKMFRLDSPIPSPRGRGLGRGWASRRLASLAKDTNLLSERDSVFEKAVVPRGRGFIMRCFMFSTVITAAVLYRHCRAVFWRCSFLNNDCRGTIW